MFSVYCSPYDTEENVDIEYNVEGFIYRDGDTATLSCIGRNVIAKGNPVITCAKGLWSATNFRCVESGRREKGLPLLD